MKVAQIWSIALAEMRSCRRLVRTWLIIVLGLLFATAQYFNLSFVHAAASHVSSSGGVLGPRYLMVTFAQILTFVFTIGILFLAFDIRSRDVKNRILEVMDSQPVNNIELLSGRLLGIVILLYIPVFFFIAALCIFGWVAEAVNLPIGTAIEPWSVASLLILDVVPNLAFWGSLTIFFSIVLRLRILVTIVVLALLVGVFWISLRLPVSLGVAISTTTGNAIYPSDLAPIFITSDIGLNRLALLAASAGFMVLAAAMHPRFDGPIRIRNAVVGSGLLGFAVAGFAGLVYLGLLDEKNINEWAQVHRQYQSETRLDLERISGIVEIRPGRRLVLDLDLEVAPPSQAEREWIFALNPGYDIDSISINENVINDYEFSQGLLKIDADDFATTGGTLNVKATGVPDANFAYLDDEINFTKMRAQDFQFLFFLGFDSYVFTSQYVALMPGIKWYPTPGSAFGETDWETHRQDFFDVDLEVDVPSGWTVASLGSRETLSSDGRERYRIAPSVPVDQIGILGAPFERRSVEIEGVEIEVLISRKHVHNLDLFKDGLPKIQSRIAERLKNARELGLEYPFETLSFVEIPASLRIYGGGWRMDSIQSMPGVMTFRESGFPTAQFDTPIERMIGSDTGEEEAQELLAELLFAHFENDTNGGNPFMGLSRNFVNNQTMPEGPGATAIAFLINQLVSSFVTEGTGYFSVYTALSQSDSQIMLQQSMNVGMSSQFGRDRGPTRLGERIRQQFSDRPAIWERITSEPLSAMDFREDPKNAFNALVLKCSAIADSLIDAAGEEKLGMLLRELRSRYNGKTYTQHDLKEVASSVGIDFDAILGDWLNDTPLPGFQMSRPVMERLLPDESGQSLYQSSFILENPEPVPGLITLSFEELRRGDREWDEREGNRMEPLLIPADSTHLVSLHTEVPIARVWLDPYLSLNRESIRLDFPVLEDHDPKDIAKLPLISPIERPEARSVAIVVDDLDEGFVIRDDSPDLDAGGELPAWLGYFVPMPPNQEDQGLPEYPAFAIGFGSSLWSRAKHPTSYGKYRHTYARSGVGMAIKTAVFSAALPHNGNWRLDYYLPDLRRARNENVLFREGMLAVSASSWAPELGLQKIVVHNGNNEIPNDFDTKNASRGWNTIGDYEINPNLVSVEVPNQTEDGRVVVADAIRWIPVFSQD